MNRRSSSDRRRRSLDWPSRRSADDEGSALVLVLLLVVISALIVVPMLSYTMSVLNANTVLSKRTARAEAVKAGFRLAMAEPKELYEKCGSAGMTVGVDLPSPGLSIPTETTCYLLDTASAMTDDELPYGITTTWAGSTPPAGLGVVGEAYPGSGAIDEMAWLADINANPVADQVWLPNLPVHGLTLRSSIPFEMPPEYVLNSYSTCDVYFPGTYKQPLEIDEPTYFTSGVYYFEDEVRVVGGADVVAGLGTAQGCVNDQYAAFYAINAPAGHNIAGLGTTFVFGDDGRIAVDDTSGPVKFSMNQRYVLPDDVGGASSARVSIATVNGDLDEVLASTDLGAAGLPLSIPTHLAVPLSIVGSTETREAPRDRYLPSTLTPAPREPFAPAGVVAIGWRDAAVVSWDEPANPTGAPITNYTVTAAPGGATCVTASSESCAVLGLSSGTTYSFTVVAQNDVGLSVPSDPSNTVNLTNSLPQLAAPSKPLNVDVVGDTLLGLLPLSAYDDAYDITWDLPSTDGGAPVTQYEAVVGITDLTPVLGGLLGTYTCTSDGALNCAVTDLSTLPGLLGTLLPSLVQVSIKVRATNAAGTSPWSMPLLVAVDLLGVPYVAPETPTPEPYSPMPVLEVIAAGTHSSKVRIPGYVSTPQGVIRASVADAALADVSIAGGILAAWIELDGVCVDECEIGQVNPITQRIIRVVTRTLDGSNMVSDAVVQVNANEGWAVNSWEVQAN